MTRMYGPGDFLPPDPDYGYDESRLDWYADRLEASAEFRDYRDSECPDTPLRDVALAVLRVAIAERHNEVRWLSDGDKCERCVRKFEREDELMQQGRLAA